MPVAGSVSAIVGPSGRMIYDDGGPNGNYSNSCNGTLTLIATDGYQVFLSGTYATQASYDILCVYDGVAVNEASLLGKYSGSDSVPAISSTLGALTIRFTSDLTTVKPGFALSAVEVTP